MKVISKLSCLAVLAIVAGCGGGSSGGALGSAGAMPGTAAAKSAEAGSDAALVELSGTGKQAAATQKLDASWVSIANENQSFTVPSGTVVQYGSGSTFVQKTVSGAGTCSTAFFGSDPTPDVVKGCYAQSGTTTGGTLLANEGGSFTVATATVVKYGTGTSWVQKTVTGTAACSNAYFGSDPAPSLAKACYSVDTTSTTPPAGTKLAAEFESFTVASATVVKYGAGTSWVQKTVTGTATCNNVYFGSDPAPNVAKACYVDDGGTTTPPTTPTAGTKLAAEFESFTVTSATVVKYGAGTSWVQKTVTGTATCNNAYFGSDPAPNVAKACYVDGGSTTPPPTSTAPPSGTKLAAEFENFTVASATIVQFGANSSWVQKSVTGSATCSVAFFGSDPLPNVAKACYSLGADTGGGSTTPPPTTGGGGTPVAGDIVDGSLTVIPSSYRSMAAQMSKDAGLAYRYGPDAASYAVGNAGIPTLVAKDAANPLNIPGRGLLAGTWQIAGPPQSDAGLYSTNWANLAYVADDSTQRMGATDIQVSGYQYNVFAQTPQISWTIGGATGGNLDSINAKAYKAAGLVNGDPVAVGRCSGRSGFCNQSLVVYQNGLIGTTGSNTSSTQTTVKLPANKVPTGIAVTNNSEFALVTVWDTTALKGQVAVVALAGLCNNCDPYKANNIDYWNEWVSPYPGLMNVGVIAFMKILGYVDLPGMTAPTEISVTTGMDQWGTLLPDGVFLGYRTPLTSQTNRQSFLSGGSNYGRYPKSGVAVVISKSEQKVAFIDLKPLFTYVNNVYFGGDLATFTSRMASLGQADNQWPYTFAQQPSQMPTVAKTVSLSGRPTAVKTSLYGSATRAWIATQDGTMHIYSLDGYASGGAAPAPSPNAFTEVGTVTGLGRNPTSIATSKAEPTNTSSSNIDPLSQQVLVSSRGDRKISWVRFASNGNSGSIVRTLQDTRMIDPISIEDADNFANSNNIVSVADYAGKAIRNYRYGPVIFIDGKACPAPNGCPVTPTGSIGIEYGGAMALPGKPFHLKTANVP